MEMKPYRTAMEEDSFFEPSIRDYIAAFDSPLRRFQLAVKRLFDLVCATLGLIAISPLLLVLAVLIRLETPGPIIFRQKRLGRYGREFTMYKFRSMYDGAPVVLNRDGSTRVVDNDPRVTRVGQVMRRFCLDELPQLANVIKGDMSLVGPRPDPAFYIEHYEGDNYRKLAMQPGVTALAHVLGRQTIAWHDRFPIETHYIEHFSLLLDFKILVLTAVVIWKGTGVNNTEQTSHVARWQSRWQRDVAG